MSARSALRIVRGAACLASLLGCAALEPRVVDERPLAGEAAESGAGGADPGAFDEASALEAGERLALRGLRPGDARRRAAALDSARAALATGDATRATAALHALARWNELPFERSEVRALVEPHLAAPEALRRRAAWRALAALGRLEGLCERAVLLVRDPDPALRAEALQLVDTACGGFVGERAQEAAWTALDAARAEGEWNRTCRALRGARLGGELEARLLECAMAGDADASLVLQAAPSKSRPLVDRLVASLAGDARAAATAAACLSSGVAPEDRAFVAQAALASWGACDATDDARRSAALRLLELHGSSDQARSLLDRCSGDAECARVAAVLAARDG